MLFRSENLLNLRKLVFSEKGGKVFLGGEEVKPEMLSVLCEQAKYLQTSQILEVLNATIVNEAANLALVQSGNSGNLERDVITAKMLHHWNFVLQNIIHKLANIDKLDTI